VRISDGGLGRGSAGCGASLGFAGLFPGTDALQPQVELRIDMGGLVGEEAQSFQ
jgi:hypothetical protein